MIAHVINRYSLFICSPSHTLIRRSSHSVPEPVEGDDFFAHPGKRSKKRQCVLHPMGVQPSALEDKVTKYRCLRCPGAASRLFIFVGVRDHLKAK